MKNTKDMTHGNSAKIILSFFLPMLMTNLLQQIYNFADTAIVGKGLGDNALAAVGNMSSLTFLIIGFSMGMANGFAVIISQNYGAKDIGRLKKSFAASIKLAAVITAVLTAVSLLFLRKIMVLMQTSEVIIEDSLRYGYIIFGGLAATMAYNMSACVLRALGDSKTPFNAIIVSSIVNIILDCVCIFGLHTGVEGAAAATIAATFFSAGICFSRIRKIEELKLNHEDMHTEPQMYLLLLKNGLPMALMNSITAVGCIVVQYFVNGLGVAYTSAYNAGSRYMNMFMLPGVTAGYTISAFTGQNFGAGRYDRIKEGMSVCIKIALIAYAALGSVMVFLPRALASVMLNGEDTISLAVRFLPISGVMLFAVDLLFVFRNCVQGMGFPLVPMISGILEMVLRISVIILLIGSFGFRATAFAEVSAWTGALIMNMSAYLYLIRRYTNKNIKFNLTANNFS
ncbi:MAG: MATE family efflux transporter [Ruminococcus sp.]|nr:MATE family efflux transporter [Ruminococcus sp.]